MILQKNSNEFFQFINEVEKLKETGLFFTDTHAHVHFDTFKEMDFVQKCIKNSVRRVVTVGIDLEDSKSAISLANKINGVYATCGVHPHDAEKFSLQTLSQFEELIEDKNVIAVGEIGLDYFRNYSDRKIQKDVFLTFLDIALFHKKPIIIHNRDATDDLIDILDSSLKNEFYGGIIHCFSGDKKLLRFALNKGFYISYAGTLTYNKAEELRDTVNFVPVDRLLIETDAPFLTPMPFRGKVNDPSYVIYTAYTLSKLKKIELTHLLEKLEKNFINLFGNLKTLI